ncbi:M-phase phosphoprotein 6 [Podila epigama]|nr:M-phase phosphoprotein 6 [Podila epigama]
MAEAPQKKGLSSKILTMKFMQRQQEQETRQKLEKEQIRVVTEAHWVLDNATIDLPKPKFQVEYEPSFLQMDAVERSSVGRVSFQKFNQVVEKSAAETAGKQQLDRELKRERQEEVGDEEMAKELAQSNMAKKVKTKRTTNRRVPPPSNAKAKSASTPPPRTFMKPKE